MEKIENKKQKIDFDLNTTKFNNWKFPVDYNDHFETPFVAYQDIDCLLELVAQNIGKSKEDLIIYDPYYCQGNMIEHLKLLGYNTVINRNSNFYTDISKNKIPEYDILLTNPPYSSNHKYKLLEYLRTIKKPFALLLPVYTATKSYWRSFSSNQFISSAKSVSIQNKESLLHIFYIIPPSEYEYTHPEGTGKDEPPFFSTWFVGLVSNNNRATTLNEVTTVLMSTKKNDSFIKKSRRTEISEIREPCRLISDIEGLIRSGLVTEKRPNPKARRRLKKRFLKGKS